MVDELKNILLAGIGTAAYTYEKASNMVDDMVKKGKLTVDEGKELSEELKRNINQKVNKNDDEKPLTKNDFIDILKQMNFASKDDISQINNRLTKLEQKDQASGV